MLLGTLLLASAGLMPLGLTARRFKSRALADRVAWTGMLFMGLFSSLFVPTLLRKPVLLAGVADYSAVHFDASHRSDPHAALAGAPAAIGVRLLLAHQPRSGTEAARAGFNLQLCGWCRPDQ